MHYPSEVDVDQVSEWLIQAVQSVSETMFALEAVPAAPEDVTVQIETAVVACIGIRGDCQLEVALSFPVALAKHLASISLEMPAAELDEKMVDDVAGEFSNMTVGAVKSRLSDMEVACAMTVPRVVRCEPDAVTASQKVATALAVIRGSAGPRSPVNAAPRKLAFYVGSSLLRADLYF
jgi:CheY-specific phosphatase CheX